MCTPAVRVKFQGHEGFQEETSEIKKQSHHVLGFPFPLVLLPLFGCFAFAFALALFTFSADRVSFS